MVEGGRVVEERRRGRGGVEGDSGVGMEVVEVEVVE